MSYLSSGPDEILSYNIVGLLASFAVAFLFSSIGNLGDSCSFCWARLQSDQFKLISYDRGERKYMEI